MMRAQVAVQRVTCDGCGQEASSEHIARRLERLEQTTRYRPIHIQAVFLSSQSPAGTETFLYGVQAGFDGEAAALLRALQIESEGRSADAVLSEFQRKGFFLTHVLECMADENGGIADLSGALRKKLPGVFRRMRTSLRPKRIFVISKELAPLSAELKRAQAGGEVVLDEGAPFDLGDAGSVARLRSAL